ncbi:MAG: MBL fold metallo-hydrolase [Atopobiaceae bacterium]|nr:MBL fold metallo-hydrolase [Atopobiaceae bacterium]
MSESKAPEDRIIRFVVGPVQSNCYLYISEGECMIVDPGASGEAIVERVPEDATVKMIVATHGHGDHVGGVAAAKRATGAPYLIHPADEEYAMHVGEGDELGLVHDDNAPSADAYLFEGQVLELGAARFRVFDSPGHSPGGVVLLGEGSAQGIAFVGDTIFQGSCGRTDLIGGDWETLQRSLHRLPDIMDKETLLLSGHGEPTTLEQELRFNPFLRM